MYVMYVVYVCSVRWPLFVNVMSVSSVRDV